MRDDRDYKVELSSAASPTPTPASNQRAAPTAGTAQGRPFVSVHFECCNVYVRIYRTPDGTAYRGHCPRCARAVNFAVGEGGTSARTFRAS